MWIARNKDETLNLYIFKPEFKTEDIWISVAPHGWYCQLPSNLYLEVKWEDEEPRELVLNLSN